MTLISAINKIVTTYSRVNGDNNRYINNDNGISGRKHSNKVMDVIGTNFGSSSGTHEILRFQTPAV